MSPCAGLCCAALLAKYGYSVTVCESHYHAGGAAHSFEVQGYQFDAGPSFFAGLSGEAGGSPNPLKQVLDAVGESVECAVYDRVSLVLQSPIFRTPYELPSRDWISIVKTHMRTARMCLHQLTGHDSVASMLGTNLILFRTH